MTTYWGERRPGQRCQLVDEGDDHNPRVLVIADIPDWVKIPEEADHPQAGHQLRVKSSFTRRCICKYRHDSRYLTLRDSNIIIVECIHSGWFVLAGKPREKICVGNSDNQHDGIGTDCEERGGGA